MGSLSPVHHHHHRYVDYDDDAGDAGDAERHQDVHDGDDGDDDVDGDVDFDFVESVKSGTSIPLVPMNLET